MLSVWHVLLASYESLRRFGPELAGACDLLVCDEGHRWASGACCCGMLWADSASIGGGL